MKQATSRARRRWDAALEAIQGDRESGATALTRAAARALPVLAELAAERDQTVWRSELRRLATVRPPFASIYRVAAAAAERLDLASGPPDAAANLRELSSRLVGELEQQHAAVVRAAARALVGARRILTISASSLVRDTLGELRSATSAGGIQVTCLESRPGLEGVRLAVDLLERGLEVRLAVDAEMGRQAAETDLVLLGADTLTPLGLIHKLGTLPLALAARRAGVQVMVLASATKLLPAPVAGWEEDGGPADEPGWPSVPGLARLNRYFDCTPLELLDLVVLEHGAVPAGLAAARAASLEPHRWVADLLEYRGATG